MLSSSSLNNKFCSLKTLRRVLLVFDLNSAHYRFGLDSLKHNIYISSWSNRNHIKIKLKTNPLYSPATPPYLFHQPHFIALLSFHLCYHIYAHTLIPTLPSMSLFSISLSSSPPTADMFTKSVNILIHYLVISAIHFCKQISNRW